jgi:sec-independent protein translocase protein TatB
MFDIGASELLMVVIVAVVVIGPKDMPMAMRTAGRWIGKMRKISGHFRSGIDAMVREAELEEMEKKWREQNEAIMKSAPQLPTAEEMQAPTSATQMSDMPPAPSADSSPASESETPPASDAQDGPAKDTRQAELHLPPPPP